MALEAQDNPFPYITLVDTADPSTPAAGTKRLWVDTDDSLKIIDESDVVSNVSGTFSGDAGDIPFTPAGTVAATDVQAAIVEVAAESRSGQEIDYVEKTSSTSVTNTAEASADTIVSGTAIAYDGSTTVLIEAFIPEVHPPSGTVGALITIWLYDGTSIGAIAQVMTPATGASTRAPVRAARRLTPSNATHTYSIRATTSTGTATAGAGAGGAGALVPAYIRITRV